MGQRDVTRRRFISSATCGAVGVGLAASAAPPGDTDNADGKRRGDQRLALERLERWESLGYGMFIHFGMSTFVANELPHGTDPPETYAPAQLDVDQWISVARDAGMKYAILTAKHVAGHCLWPAKHTSYSVAHSGDRTDLCEKFVAACTKRGLMAGFYYCSWDNHHRFGSLTPSDQGTRWNNGEYDFVQLAEQSRKDPDAPMTSFTSSLYQSFQTAQVTELLTRYGPIGEMWIDIPGLLGRGYRQYLYEEIARLQPDTVIMMNSGIGTGDPYPVDYAWPSDLVAIERRLPPENGHQPWRTIEGRRYYIPGEMCDPIGKHWFFVDGDDARPAEELLNQFTTCRQRGVNVLLNVPPDRRGLIPDGHVRALQQLRERAGL